MLRYLIYYGDGLSCVSVGMVSSAIQFVRVSHVRRYIDRDRRAVEVPIDMYMV